MLTCNQIDQPAPRQSRYSARAGITLTEVLISVFVLGTGLLGLASMVPLGQYHAVQANHQDRAAACARWVFRQFDGQTGAAANPNSHLLSTFSWVNQAGTPVYFISRPRVVMIDPRFIAANVADVNAASFPYGATAADPNWDLPRISIADPQNGGSPMRPFLANELCIWRDDILFDSLNDNDRPDIAASNATPTNPIGANFSSDGNYSWLAMVRPSELETLPPTNPQLTSRAAYLPLNQPSQFVVTVIVTHNRAAVIDLNENAPSERQVQAALRGPGWFELDGSRMLGAPIGRLTPNQWVMISAQQAAPANEPAPNPPLWFHRWYKIVNVTDVNTVNGNRAIKVSGPDWPVQMLDPNQPVICTIIDGAVGVYERQMTYNVTFDNQ